MTERCGAEGPGKQDYSRGSGYRHRVVASCCQCRVISMLKITATSIAALLAATTMSSTTTAMTAKGNCSYYRNMTEVAKLRGEPDLSDGWPRGEGRADQ